MNVRKIKLSIDSRYDNVQMVGNAVNSLCSLTALPEDSRHRVELCVTEAVVNSIKHGYHDEPGHIVDTIFSLHDDKLVIDVVDTGISMDPYLLEESRKMDIDFDPEDIESVPCSGRGLAIIQEYMDAVCYSEHGRRKYLTMTKYFDEKQG